jgi:tetratricopeptide (TPR) repeat protein
MFKFEHIIYLYGLLALPLMLLLVIWYFIARKNKLKKIGNPALVNNLIPYASKRKRIIKVVLFALGFSSLVIALCNLQTGSKLTEVKREGADIIVCLDVSNSMLAQDLSPNRLTRAKYALEKMIDGLNGDRLGLIIFAGEAYVQLPITTDYSAAKLFLESIGPGMVPVQGTNIEAAIEKASESFSNDEGKNRAIILITDGENHSSEAIASAEKANKAGIMINTIGIGSEKGVPIPLIENGEVKGYRKDKEGQTVVTKLNSEVLKQIAGKANGVYVQASQADVGLSAVLDKIGELDKAQLENKMYTDYEDQFQWFLGLALIFFFIEFLISERVSEWFKKINLFGNTAKPATTLFFIALSLSYFAQDDAKNIYYGNKLYKSGLAIEATQKYREALKINPNNQKAQFNLGNTLFKNAQQIKTSKENFIQGGKKVTPDSLANLVFDEAAQNFATVANTISNKDTLHLAWHNIGNCYLQKKDYQQAIDAYKKSLKFNPKDEETRYNLAYALKHLPPKKKDGGGGQNNQPQNKKEEDKNDKNKNAQPKEGQMNKEQAEQLLKALMNKEQKLQDKRKQKQEDASKTSVEKDW